MRNQRQKHTSKYLLRLSKYFFSFLTFLEFSLLQSLSGNHGCVQKVSTCGLELGKSHFTGENRAFKWPLKWSEVDDAISENSTVQNNV